MKTPNDQHRKLRYLLRLLPAPQDGPSALQSARSIGFCLGVEVRNPKWTSYGAIEVDVFARSREDFDLFLAAVTPLGKVEFVNDLNSAPPHLTDEETALKARGLFNGERYWESHEVLEGVWRTLDGEAKRYLQGLILVCAAFVHHQKGKDDVAFGVLGRALPQIESPAGRYDGVDPMSLVAEVQLILKTRTFRTFKI